MKLFAFLTFLVTAVSAGSRCGTNKHPAQLNAIGRFCQKQNMVVPSPYAMYGVGGISITGSCKPAQWVPMEYCMSQFQEMCSNSEKQRRYGRNGCQVWKINYGGLGLFPDKPAAPEPQKPPQSVILPL